MVRDIERIEQDLTSLNQRVEAINQTLHDSYSSYLDILGAAVKQQLISATYQICTQGYPEQFLSLSLRQRQQLQETLQQVANQGQAYLVNLLSHQEDPQAANLEADSQQTTIDPTRSLGNDAFRDRSALEEGPKDLSAFPPQSEEAVEPDLPPAIQDPRLGAFSSGSSSSGSFSKDATQSSAEFLQFSLRLPKPQLSPPAKILRQYDQLERKVGDLLRSLSRQVNHLMQDDGILPKYFPEPVLEAAAKSEAFEAMASPPNLLSLTVEAIDLPPDVESKLSDPKKAEGKRSASLSSSPPMRIMAVHMRLSEIEFVDTTVMSWRSRLRDCIVQLKALDQDYTRVQRELAIAKAEAAWRSSWTVI